MSTPRKRREGGREMSAAMTDARLEELRRYALPYVGVLAREDVGDLIAEIVRLKDQLAEAQSDESGRGAKLADATVLIDELRAELATLRAELGNQSNELQHHKEAAEQLRERFRAQRAAKAEPVDARSAYATHEEVSEMIEALFLDLCLHIMPGGTVQVDRFSEVGRGQAITAADIVRAAVGER